MGTKYLSGGQLCSNPRGHSGSDSVGSGGLCSRAGASEEDRQFRNDSGPMLLVPRLLMPRLGKTVEHANQQDAWPRNHRGCRAESFNISPEPVDFIPRGFWFCVTHSVCRVMDG